MSGVLNRQLNTLAGRSRPAVAAAAAAAARHHGRTPSSSSTSALASIARNSSSSLAGCASDNNNNDSGSTTPINNSSVGNRSSRFDPADRDADLRRSTAAAAAAASSTAPSASSGAIHGGGGGGGGARRAVSSIATSPASGARTASASASASPMSSLLAPAASAYSSSSLLPSATNGGGGGGGGGGAARVDAVVIGAGQAGLSVAYHLQKAGGLRVVALDANQEPGGAWRHRWPSLELFSTRKWSSLPGYPMFANAACEDGYPTTGEMAMYMAEYESVMNLNVVRPVKVTGVSRTAMGTFLVDTDCLLGGSVARWEARTVISAAGTHASPVWPRLPGSETFRGTQIHSSQYRSAEEFRGKRVAVVGAGNSGAQILAEVSAPGVAAAALWSTMDKPSFLPMGLSGKEIFDTVARLRQKQGFVREGDIPSLHSIIMQPGVIEAAERGAYDQRVPALARLTRTGVAWEASPEGGVPAGGHCDVDAIIWCTGYRSNTSHLSRLGLVKKDSTVAMEGSEMGETEVPGVFAVGYGNWAGVGSGSIPGSTVYAKRAAAKAVQHLRGGNSYDASRLAVEAAMRSRSSMSRISDGSSSGGGSRGWPTAGRASVRAATAVSTLSGAPQPPVSSAAKYGGGQREEQEQEEAQKRVSVAA